jgi:glycosyltransferase involved in cell wall biosynthesis
MEALASGVPVVMSDVGGAREQLDGVARGYLVANPAGDADLLDWDTISSMRFRAQGNKDELVHAMSTVVSESDLWARRRLKLSAESRSRFPSLLCLERHAQVLSAVARGAAIPHFM